MPLSVVSSFNYAGVIHVSLFQDAFVLRLPFCTYRLVYSAVPPLLTRHWRVPAGASNFTGKANMHASTNPTEARTRGP